MNEKTTVSERDYLTICNGVYDNELYKRRYDAIDPLTGKPYGPIKYSLNGHEVEVKILATTADHKDLEANGLQAMLVEINGKKVMVTRGSEQVFDWLEDFGLLDKNAYKKENSQFKDLEKFVGRLNLSAAEMKDLVWTGHSLGGGLATYGQVVFGGKGIVFAAVNPYNVLDPKYRDRLADADVENFHQLDDPVTYIIPNVPTIGKNTVVKGQAGGLVSSILRLLGIDGHTLWTYIFDGEEMVRGIGISNIIGLAGSTIIKIITEKILSKVINADPKILDRIRDALTGGAAKIGGNGGKLFYDKFTSDNAIAHFTKAQEHVAEIQQVNAAIPVEMERIYRETVETISDSFHKYLSYSEVEAMAEEEGLHFRAHYSQGLVDEVNFKLKEEIEDIEKIKNGTEEIIREQLNLDEILGKNWSV